LADAVLGDQYRLELPIGNYSLWAEHDSGWRSETVQVEVTNGVAVEPFTLRFPRETRISVKLNFVDAYCLGSFRLYAAPVRPSLTDEETLDERRELKSELYWSNSQKAWQTRDMVPGEYIVALYEDAELRESQHVSLTTGGAETSFSVQSPKLADCIYCTVNTPRHLNEPTFSLVGVDASVRMKTWTLRRGEYLLECTGESRGKVLRLCASITEIGWLSQPLGRLKNVAVQFDFKEPTNVELRIRNMPDVDRFPLTIAFCDSTGQWESMNSWGTVNHGVLTVSSGAVQPGEFRLVISHAGGTKFPPLADGEYAFSGSSVEVTIELPCLHEVVIEKGVSEATRLRLISKDWEGDELWIGASGNCIVPWVPEGSYTVKYETKKGKRELTFHVSGDCTITLAD